MGCRSRPCVLLQWRAATRSAADTCGVCARPGRGQAARSLSRRDLPCRGMRGQTEDMSRDYYKYGISVATDGAVSFGRARYCTRVPVSRAQMAQIVAYLNAQNALYRNGDRRLDWKLFQDDCRHLARNALSAAEIWPMWPTDMPLLIAMFDFPVPKNECVDLVQRSNAPATLVRGRCTRTRIRDATCCGSVGCHGGQAPWSKSRRRRSRTRSMTPISDWRSTTIVFCNRINGSSTRSSASHAISTSSRICDISPRCSGG
jgi:hypothetical protein